MPVLLPAPATVQKYIFFNQLDDVDRGFMSLVAILETAKRTFSKAIA